MAWDSTKVAGDDILSADWNDLVNYVKTHTSGDMTKAVYDTDDDGVVDDAEKLNGQLPAYYLDRANHTGTQTASTISDFDTEVSNNADVSANTSARHDAVTLAGTPDYLTISGQQITLNKIDLTTDVTGVLPNANVADDITLTNITQITNRSHTDLTDIGTNTHAQIDSHMASTSNPHNVTASQVGIDNTDDISEGTTNLYYTEARVSSNSDVSANTTHRNTTSGNPHNVSASDVGNTTAQWNANKLQGVDIDSTAPTDGQVLTYDNATSKWKPTDSSGSGDMLKSTYDTDNDGVVDNAEKLEGQAGSYYLNRANHTGTQTASTISDFDTEVSNNADVSANTSARHTQNTDTGTSATEFYVDTGGANVAVKAHIQSTSNPHSVTASQVGINNTDDVSEGSTNLYYTEARVSANTDVSANTTHRNTTSGNPHNVTASDVGAITEVSDDTTPQLGGFLDINAKGFTEELTAGEAVSSGDLCYLKSDGKMWKADASAESTASTLLAIATESISADATGTFLINGSFTSSSLTVGSIYYVSETAGAFTATAPTTSGSIVRIIGYAISATRLYFNPDNTYIENS